MLAMQVLRLMLDRFSGDGGADTSGSRGGRSGAGPRARGRGAGTMTSSLTFQQDARRYGHVCVCVRYLCVCVWVFQTVVAESVSCVLLFLNLFGCT